MAEQLQRKFLRFLGAFSALMIAVSMASADVGAAAKNHVAHKSSAHHKKAAVTSGKKHGKGRVAKTAKAKPVQQAVITVKRHEDAPDFDFQPRIQEAQALAAKQPVLPGDMVVSGNQLTSFNWVLVVGEKTGPLTVLHTNEQGRNDQRMIVTWPVNNYLNTKFSVADAAHPAGGLIVFAQRRPVRGT
ncbi:MAG: hypothetical protein NTX21_05105, partial [Alphaproteobacteria bacterium]|nr:hypothetical protein [Alphaproteobacteria bacterium]